jgi:HSP20 family molecular chaperone IbpA
MKNENAIELVGPTPVIFKLLPEDHFFKRAADIHELTARRAYELAAARGFGNGHELDDWIQAEDQLFNSIPLKVSEDTRSVTIKAALPEYSAADIEIHVGPKSVFITGHHHECSEENKDQISPATLCSKRLFHGIELPADVDAERAKVTFHGGELRIDLPKARVKEKAATLKAAA